jgi:biopolymer transport protein ExbD
MADVNVTSLVDVMLVLLIVFMITAPMMQGGVDVELPRAEARPLSPKEGMVVSVNRDGRIFVDQTPVSYNDFRVTFRSLVTTRKPTGVYLQADTRVPYGQVVRVLAVIRGAGVQNVGLVAREKAKWRTDRGRPPAAWISDLAGTRARRLPGEAKSGADRSAPGRGPARPPPREGGSRARRCPRRPRRSRLRSSRRPSPSRSRRHPRRRPPRPIGRRRPTSPGDPRAR